MFDKPLLDQQLAVVAECGISDVSLVTGYAAEALSGYGTRQFHNAAFATTNMVASLFEAHELFDQRADLIVAYGDIVYSASVLRALVATPASLSTVVDLNWRALWCERMDNPLEDAEKLKISKQGLLTEIGGNPGNIDDIEGQYIGLTKITASAQHAVLACYRGLAADDKNPSYDKLDMTGFLQLLIDGGTPVAPVPINGGWLEVDTVEDRARYERLRARGQLDRFFRPVI